ncbi:S-adenosylmethionine synthetase [Planctomycetes bacterium CA13]|uniref:S-adenosylmethionine synthetase n=1 Tax=Novipirellula herctigrandis TaxID=2527986 RepID=A0A5C5YX22_9BACT|nr:S-adenosylmethionine synthetase [Planctomycetes bacterium CA13]
MEIQLSVSSAITTSNLPFEYVERKGLGHPDSICDSVMEAAASALRREYVERFGRELHYNLDKAMLVAGESSPKLGGGKIERPMQFIAGDRATTRFGKKDVPVDEIVESAVLDWLRNHMRFMDVRKDVNFRSEIKAGSAELTGIFDREVTVANDTSAAVGYAPLSETERIVLETEHFINSADFQHPFPFAGEDVKVMGVRHHKQLRMTIAVAMVDQFIPTAASYYDNKQSIREAIVGFVNELRDQIEEVTVDINMLDDPSRAMAGMYLTVIGTSAESGDGGEVGRGNAVNGLISLNRPTSNEAAAGKNTMCHVGNIYNHLTHKIAAEIVQSIAPVQEATVWLCSQIGSPIDQPWSTSVDVVLESSVTPNDVRKSIEEIVQRAL